MEKPPFNSHFFTILSCFTLVFFSQSRPLPLLQSDSNALSLVLKHVRPPSENPRYSAGIFWEQRTSNSSHVLKITPTFPPPLRSFRNLRFINMSANCLLQVPAQLTQIPKRYVFAETNQTTPSSSNAAAEAPGLRVRRNHKKKIVRWVLGFGVGMLTGCVFGLTFSVVFNSFMTCINVRRGNSTTRLKIFSPLIKKAEDLSFLEKEDGLASLELIGRGGCGEVYKSVLPGNNSKEIAIKKIIQPARDAEELTADDSKSLNKKMRQIKSEIQTIGRMRHRNLVPLLAHLPQPNCHFLVYEYMKNGSLQDYLRHVAEGKRELDWMARYKIALGVSSALEYLHMNHSPLIIIHRDLKPANILLDDEMEARIADFGLAKAMPDANTYVSTSNVAGTIGYIAPEYHQVLQFTDKCDIYSFGVVLGALITGRLPSDLFFQDTDELSLVNWMRRVMVSADPERAIDGKLLGSGFEEQILFVLKVACFCMLDNPRERPNSKDVTREGYVVSDKTLRVVFL